MNDIEKFFSSAFNTVKEDLSAPFDLMKSVSKTFGSPSVLPMLLLGAGAIVCFKLVQSR